MIYFLGRYSQRFRKFYYNRTHKYLWGLIHFVTDAPDWDQAIKEADEAVLTEKNLKEFIEGLKQK